MSDRNITRLIGDMAARALDEIEGHELVGAVLIVQAVDPEQAADIVTTRTITPIYSDKPGDYQPRVLTLGLVEWTRQGIIEPADD